MALPQKSSLLCLILQAGGFFYRSVFLLLSTTPRGKSKLLFPHKGKGKTLVALNMDPVYMFDSHNK